MSILRWGIIGCGDVTEVKSGPAFNKVPNSTLVAVMRRDEEKARDYAKRHNVPTYYTNAQQLIDDPAINAIYVATPPSSHEEYTLAAIQAGKPVYVEKPMTLDAASAKRMAEAAESANVKLSVAHYRRAQPIFLSVRKMIDEKMIGQIRLVQLNFLRRPLSKSDLEIAKTSWRVDPAISGGGLFHDMAPHQLDILYQFFGKPTQVSGNAVTQSQLYDAADVVTAQAFFPGNILFNGAWCFNIGEGQEKDQCIIYGEKGTIEFSFFDAAPVTVTVNNKSNSHTFDKLEHVQQPMIELVTNYFLGGESNPSSAEEGVDVMEMMDRITTSSKFTVNS